MKSLFQRPQRKTAPKNDASAPPTQQPPNSISGYSEPLLQSAFAQSPGVQREYNEDALLCLELQVAYQDINRSAGFYAIADGMGGHQYGEVASKVAINSIASTLMQAFFLPQINPSAAQPQNSVLSILREAILNAHQAVLQKASGGGTTLTCCLVYAKTLTIAHVGDSRAYYIGEDGEVKLYTRDHSLVKRLVELGQISEQEAQNHPQRNVLYRALGQTDPIETDVFSLPLPPDGYLLLCSDGLWGVVPESTILQTIRQSARLQDACNWLVHLANEAGGPDNISVILVKFLSASSSE